MARDRSNRFNAKARQSGLNKLKEEQKIKERKKQAKLHALSNNDNDNDNNEQQETVDTNAEFIIPKSKEQLEKDKQIKLERRKEVRNYNQFCLLYL